MKSSQARVRAATPADVRLIMRFIMELAIYEKAPHEVKATEQDILASLFAQNPKVFALICELDDEPVGFAVYFYNFSTWLGRHGIYLEDLYVSPDSRGRGCGKALLRHIAEIALAEGCGRFEWSVLDWNTPSIEFYERLGAKAQSEWMIYRTTGGELQALAKGTDVPVPTGEK